ncbi:hypothetical protein N7499_006355 [Penicillium canescens]|nr:hypothetical protein N7499_006355 [Penicillium canescens]KAJ6176722.1 hypothetical protein N7485_003636 [Penicillium canescens]
MTVQVLNNLVDMFLESSRFRIRVAIKVINLGGYFPCARCQIATKVGNLGGYFPRVQCQVVIKFIDLGSYFPRAGS